MINNDYIDAFAHGYVVQQRTEEIRRAAEQQRMIKAYRAAHPEQRPAARVARLLRRMADRLAPEPEQPITTRAAHRPLGSS